MQNVRIKFAGTRVTGAKFASQIRRLCSLCVCAAVVTTLAMTSGCDDREKRTVEHINNAVLALNQANYLMAQGQLKKALAINPSDADATFYLGFLQLREGKAKDARKLLETSMATGPLRPDGWLHLARACHQLGDYKASQSALKKLFTLDELHPEGHFLWARIALKARKREVVDKHLRLAIKGDPGHSASFLALGRLYSEVGAYEAGLKVLQEGMRFSPDSIHLQQAYGLAWLDVGRPDRAKDVFAVAEKNPRADYTLHLNYAAALLQLGDKENAIKQLERYLLLGRTRAHKRELTNAARMLIKLKRG